MGWDILPQSIVSIFEVMVSYTVLILKWNQELLDLHKRVIKTYLVQESVSASGRRKFFALYDHYINAKNILRWFYIPADIFVKILVYDQLEEMANYTFPKKKRKNGKRKT